MPATLQTNTIRALCDEINTVQQGREIHLCDSGLVLCADGPRVTVDSAEGESATSDPLSPKDLITVAAWALARIPAEWEPNGE